MVKTTTSSNIFKCLDIQPTTCQAKALYEIENFLDNKEDQVFILKGSAGTGKTTLTKALVDYLSEKNKPFHLLSPTAKAASILSDKTNHMAHTIHHLIYTPETLDDGRVKFNFKENESDTPTIFIVDEASMIPALNPSTGEYISQNPLLLDLLKFVFNGNKYNQIIFLGDSYQLQPIHEKSSMALSKKALRENFKLKCQEIELNEVVRQASDSPVLSLALEIKRAKDYAQSVYSIKPERLRNEDLAIDYFMTFFDVEELNEVMLIAKTNEQVERYNQLIRKRLGFYQTLEVGEVVMLRNNIQKDQQTFVNGDIGLIKSLSSNTEEIAGIRFKDATIQFENSGEKTLVKTKIFLDSLLNNTASIDSQSLKNLKHNRMKHNGTFRQSERVNDDPYMNAMKLSYAYAMTCNKAQGSEWSRVLFTSEKLHPYDHPWLYTAVTRAKNEVLTWRF
ncbi:AAA family ATPase [uncultured Arcticibacterium sp.]|uniref:ATP-dependent DNA helicase n=1 Tax=uncultured Arcticibacterium sp. TaxID=2173042 RepID=UPI0030FA0D87